MRRLRRLTMSVSISELTDAEEDEYEAFHLSVPTLLLYGSARYRRFLAAVLPGATSHYLLARCGGRIAAALPCFRRDCGGVGSVINSLPFYGSHGGVIGGPWAEAGSPARALLSEFAGFGAGASAVTIVSSPLDGLHRLYQQVFRFRFRGERIGQMISLPLPGRDVDDALMARLHSKTRNTVRNKSGLTFAIDGEPVALSELARLHRESMATLGGLAKPCQCSRPCARASAGSRTIWSTPPATGTGIVSALLVLFYTDRRVLHAGHRPRLPCAPADERPDLSRHARCGPARLRPLELGWHLAHPDRRV